MKKINFVNDNAPYLSAETLNLLQNNIEQAIGEGGGVGGDTLPIGTMMPYGNANAPKNWLVCDGSEIPRTEYPELFAVIGTNYGSGDGSTTFNLPNKKGKVSVGLNTSDTDFNKIGKTGGEKQHILTIDEMPRHAHSLTFLDQSHAGELGQLDVLKQESFGGFLSTYRAVGSTYPAGNSQPHNVLQPYEVDNWIIKAHLDTPILAEVENVESNSETDAYSCNYINNLGTIIETGSNDLGNWIKFSTGFMLCNTKGIKTGVSVPNVYGNSNNFFYGSFDIELPIAFARIDNALFGKAMIESQMNWYCGSVAKADLKTITCYIMDVTERGSVNVHYDCTVIGTWK